MAKIIIVEDDPMISEIYQRKFSEAGFEVLAAETGDQAILLAKKTEAEVMLLDLLMPKTSGFDVLAELKQGPNRLNIIIIVFSNLGQTDDRERAIKLGADGFIIKSDFSPSALVAEVNRLVNQFDQATLNEKRIAEEERGRNFPSTTAVTADGPKILMIEDEDVFVEMFGEKLKQDGFRMVFAKNGNWGIKEAFSSTFDLFIIDMVMAGMFGEEIIAKLKSDDRTKNIPIIVLSASVDKDAERAVYNLGVKDFFIKTQLTPSELSKKVREALAR